MIGTFVLSVALSITTGNWVEKEHFTTEKACQERLTQLSAQNWINTKSISVYQCTFKGVK